MPAKRRKTRQRAGTSAGATRAASRKAPSRKSATRKTAGAKTARKKPASKRAPSTRAPSTRAPSTKVVAKPTQAGPTTPTPPGSSPVDRILARLESLGNDARRRHNTKAGAPDNQFGVKLGDIRVIANAVKSDHALALCLWDTANVEAQLLATLILTPALLSAEQIDAMTRSTTCSQVADWLNSYVVSQHPEKESLRRKWMKDRDRWAARAGWHLTASRINKGAGSTPNAGDSADELDPAALLDRIEKELASALPEVQWTMNNTLAAIGIRHPELRARAVTIGEKIGLYRDWPVSKGCTPPYVPVWIDAMTRRAR